MIRSFPARFLFGQLRVCECGVLFRAVFFAEPLEVAPQRLAADGAFVSVVRFVAWCIRHVPTLYPSLGIARRFFIYFRASETAP